MNQAPASSNPLNLRPNPLFADITLIESRGSSRYNALQVRYLIWQGRIWSPDGGDQNGWGRPYTGGGIYDATDATGGHYDHIHASVARL